MGTFLNTFRFSEKNVARRNKGKTSNTKTNLLTLKVQFIQRLYLILANGDEQIQIADSTAQFQTEY